MARVKESRRIPRSSVRAPQVFQPTGNFVDGGWSASAGSSYLINPATEEAFVEVPLASPEDVDRAVQVAKRAFDEGPWPRMSLGERWGILSRAQTMLRDVREEMAGLK